MQDIPTKVDGVDVLPAAEFNQIPDELENAIESTGITLSSGDLFQLAKTIANYSGSGNFYTDSGAADAYVLSVVSSKQGPTAYVDGMEVRFEVGNTNTGASTVNVNGLGVKNIKTPDGNDPAAGDLTVGGKVTLHYDDSSGYFIIYNIATGGAIAGSFTSPEQTITSAGSLVIAHGLSVEPTLIQVRLICKIADLNYSVDDEVIMGNSSTGTFANKGHSVVPDATNLNIRYSSDANVYAICDKTTGTVSNITIASWKLIIKAWVL